MTNKIKFAKIKTYKNNSNSHMKKLLNEIFGIISHPNYYLQSLSLQMIYTDRKIQIFCLIIATLRDFLIVQLFRIT